MTEDDLKEAIHKFDVITKPYILLVNPQQKDTFENALKECGYYDIFKVQEDPCVEINKAYVMDRAKLKSWAEPTLNPNKFKWANNDFRYTWSDLE